MKASYRPGISEQKNIILFRTKEEAERAAKQHNSEAELWEDFDDQPWVVRQKKGDKCLCFDGQFR